MAISQEKRIVKDKVFFGNSKKIISTYDVLENLTKNHHHKIDQAATIRTRLFDILIGDWDRHDDQWRWASFKEKNKTIYRPIPRDRDQVYSKYDGALFSVLRYTIPFLKQLRKYDQKIPPNKIQWVNYHSRHFDRTFMTEGDWEDWEAEANYIKENVTDEIIEAAIKKYNFNNIEPFTMVLVDWNESLRFYELVWDGKQKHITKLPLEPKIWSSSTLYSEAMKVERKHWFEVFKNEVDLNPKSLLNFHKNTNKENTEYGIVMDRGFVKTTSITQVEKQNHAAEMRFYNLQENTDSKSRLSFLNTIND